MVAIFGLLSSSNLVSRTPFSSVYIPASGISVTHWTHKIAFALSITGMGSGIGGFVWPNALQAMLDAVGPRWAYRIMAAMGFVVLSACAIVIKPKVIPVKKGKVKFFDLSMFKSNKHYWLLSMVAFWLTLGYYVSKTRLWAFLSLTLSVFAGPNLLPRPKRNGPRDPFDHRLAPNRRNERVRTLNASRSSAIGKGGRLQHLLFRFHHVGGGLWFYESVDVLTTHSFLQPWSTLPTTHLAFCQ